ncbi:unnamed protein product [Rotaria sp. Silwood1]|nr:unnamed protein product [Rotaria sp. Silwood1]
MSESTSADELSNIDVTATNEQPRKYLRRNEDISIGVTTRSRQREQDKKNKESEPTESMPTDQSMSNTLNTTTSIEQCAICMENFAAQEVGIPENCEHSFCLACIIEWAKKNNSCPIDRIAFRRIFKKHSFISSKPYDTMKVKDNRIEVQLEDDFLEMIDDDITCRVCGRDDQEDLLLICDECGNGYHTFCLELPGVPETPEWMCPLCEVDQLSADEVLYENSDIEELQDILFDDTLNTTETDTEVADTTVPVRQTRVRQTARTGGVRNQRTTSPNTRPRRRRRQRQSRRRRIPTTRRLTLMEQQRQRQRRQRQVLHDVNRRIDNVNTRTREGSTSTNAQSSTNRNDTPRLSIFDGEPIALEDESSSTTTTTTAMLPAHRSIITPNEAARRIAASGIPIMSRSHTEPSISRELSIRRTTPILDRVPSRTIRPPRIAPTQPRIPINQLPRIQRRTDAPVRPSPTPRSSTMTTRPSNSTSSVAPSFIDNLLNSQERLHNLQNMSIQEPPVRFNIPEQTPSSSIVTNPGNEAYDPFTIDYDDDGDNKNNNNESEQLKNAKHQKQDSIRINNGMATHPVINNTNTSSNSDKSSSLQTNEQEQSQHKSKSPVEHNNNHSDHRSQSPSHRNHNSSDRKRRRPSSPNSSIVTTVNNNESSSNIDTISSSKHKKSSRNDERKKSKHHLKRRSSSVSSSSKSPSSPSTSNNHKKTFDLKDEKSSNSSYNKSTRRSEKRDDYYSHRSRNYPSYTSSKYSSRDYSSSTHQSNADRRTTHSNFSSPPRLLSKIVTTDGNSSLHNNETKQHEISTEDRNRIYNRLKNMNDTNTPIIPINHSNKISSPSSSFSTTNGGSQRSRSNLIQIVTTAATSEFTQAPPVRLLSSQIKSESVKPLSVPSIPAKVESKTNTNDSIQSTITSKTNGNTADDMLMEEMLLEEEQEQSPVKSIDLDSLTIPEASIQKIDSKEESIKVITPTTTATTATVTITTTTTSTTTSVPSLTPSPTKKPYTLYKVPHTNHMTPRLSSRHKKQSKKESSTTQPDSTTTNKPSTDDNSRQTSLDERISNLFGAPPPPPTTTTSSNKSINSSTEQQQQQIDNRTNPTTIISTPSDKSTESPQDIPSLISTMIKKEQDHLSLTKKLNINDERRSTTSKHYTTEWLASQKPEEAPTEDLIALPSLVTLPTLVSSQPSTTPNTIPPISNSGEATMLGKLSEAMSKLIQKQGDTNLPTTATTTTITTITTTETDDTVPISAKHLERIERRKQREKRQSEIAAIAKEALKPAFRRHDITKDEYKEIMKKVVTKATNANEVDRVRISKMIDAYVQKYRTIRQHNISKTSNGNSS